MIEWLAANAGTAVVLFAVIALVAFLTVYLWKKRKSGGTCGCGCASCPMAGKCHGEKTLDK